MQNSALKVVVAIYIGPERQLVGACRKYYLVDPLDAPFTSIQPKFHSPMTDYAPSEAPWSPSCG